MTAIETLLTSPHAERIYLITVEPYAFIRASMAQVASGNRLTAAAGTFSGLLLLDSGLKLSRPATGDVTIAVTDVARDGSWVAISGVTLSDVAASTCTIQGLVTRLFSTNGYVTEPTESPASRWYDNRVNIALRFTRTLFNGAAIGGRAVPGYGDVQLCGLDGGLDAVRSWGWAGRRIVVEIGGRDFARADFKVLLNGLTNGIRLDNDQLTIAVRDLAALMEQPLWTPRYLGTGGVEGDANLAGVPKPVCIGYCENIEPVSLGIVNGRWTYQYHGLGAAQAYDSTKHRVRSQGQPLAYVASNPGAGQWSLDATNGLIIAGGSAGGGAQPLMLTADVLGSADVTAPSVARIMEWCVTNRLAMDSASSGSTLSVGAGSKSLSVDQSLPLTVGGKVLLALADDPDNVWMFGSVASWDGSALTVTVPSGSFAGTGSYSTWVVTKIGLTDDEIVADTFDDLHTANPAAANLWLPAGGQSALTTFDRLINSIGGHYGFDRDGRFKAGLVAAPATASLSLLPRDVLELERLETSPPRWRTIVRYRRNWRPFTANELSADTRRNLVTNGTFDADTDWTKGGGWAITGGAAVATAGSASNLSQTLTPTVGEDYILTAAVTVAAGSVQFKLAGVNAGSPITASGTVEITYTAASASIALDIAKGATFSGSIDNIAMTVSRLRFLTQEWRTVTAADASVRAIYGPQAVSVTIDTALTDAVAAQAEADRQQALHGQFRDVFRALAKTSPFASDIADTVSLTDHRYGLADGRDLVVLGLDEDAGDNRVSLTLWG